MLQSDDEEEVQFETEPESDVDELKEESVKDSIAEAPTKKTKSFYCDTCEREISFDNNIEFLRHKASHNDC